MLSSKNIRFSGFHNSSGLKYMKPPNRHKKMILDKVCDHRLLVKLLIIHEKQIINIIEADIEI
jgi:hypothetical protein